MKLTNIGTVAVPTADQDRAIAFYVDVLGLSVRVDAPFGNGQRWVEVAAGDAETTIALPPSLPNTPTGIDTGIRLRTADAEADHAYLVEQGVDVDDVMRWPGVPPMFSLRDLDKNILYVVENA